jgi:hypothetical protein
MTRLEYFCQHVRTITYVGHGGEARTACSACGVITWRGTDAELQNFGPMFVRAMNEACDVADVAALLQSIPGVKP